MRRSIASRRARSRAFAGFLWKDRVEAQPRPVADSLRLLPSGPDRVGERRVRNRTSGARYKRLPGGLRVRSLATALAAIALSRACVDRTSGARALRSGRRVGG